MNLHQDNHDCSFSFFFLGGEITFSSQFNYQLLNVFAIALVVLALSFPQFKSYCFRQLRPSTNIPVHILQDLEF